MSSPPEFKFDHIIFIFSPYLTPIQGNAHSQYNRLVQSFGSIVCFIVFYNIQIEFCLSSINVHLSKINWFFLHFSLLIYFFFHVSGNPPPPERTATGFCVIFCGRLET